VLVSNTGNLTAANLVLTDLLPATLALLSDTLKAGAGGLLVFSDTPGVIVWRGALPPGQKLGLTFALTATPSTSLGNCLTNTVWLASDGLAPLSRQAAIAYHRFVYLPLLSKNAIKP